MFTRLILGLAAAGAIGLAAALAAGLLAGGDASPSIGQLEMIWGRRGVADGRFQKPRAIAIDAEDRIYVVDMRAKIQVYDPQGRFLRSWQTPAWEHGKPTGLSIDRRGNLLVADTHYFRMLVYTPEGVLLEDRTIGGQFGYEPGKFGLVTDAVEDSRGNYYVAEYGEFDRIQKFSPQGEFLYQWGGHGDRPGQFLRPQNLAIDERDHLWVADACNHRIQVFDLAHDPPRLVRIWGEHGSELGKLSYPYDLVLDGQGHVYICEYGNHRVQKFTLDGRSLGAWGAEGRGPGQLYNPWALVRDSRGRLHVLDTNNHRVQCVKM